VKDTGDEWIVLVFEGRTQAGKGRHDQARSEHSNPRGATVVAMVEADRTANAPVVLPAEYG